MPSILGNSWPFNNWRRINIVHVLYCIQPQRRTSRRPPEAARSSSRLRENKATCPPNCPGIISDITNDRETCVPCQIHIPSHRHEPTESDPPPKCVFEDASADLFSHSNHHYIVYADRYQGGPPLNSGTTAHQPKMWFRSDRGLQFAGSDLTKFLERWGVNATLSTAHYPQRSRRGGGHVKAMKSIHQQDNQQRPSRRWTDFTSIAGMEKDTTERWPIARPGHSIHTLLLAHHRTFTIGETGMVGLMLQFSLPDLKKNCWIKYKLTWLKFTPVSG